MGSDPPTQPPPVPPRRRPETLFAVLRRFSRLWGFLLFLVFVVVLFRAIILPFVFAFIVAYLLAPLVRRLQPKITRVGAVILVYLCIIFALGVFFGLLLPAVTHDLVRLRDAAPAAVDKLNTEWIPRASRWVDQYFGELWAQDVPAGQPPSEVILFPEVDGSWRVDLQATRLEITETSEGSWSVGVPSPTSDAPGDEFRRLVASKGAEFTAVIGPWIQSFVTSVASFLTNFVVTFMIAAFVLIDLERVNRFIRSLIPHEYRSDFDELMVGMDRGLTGVIRGQLLICLINGVLTFIGLVIFQIKYSFLLALLAGVFSLIPIFGTIVSSIPILVVALVSDANGLAFGRAFAMLGWIAGIHLLEANVLNPKIIGDSAQIHPVVVVFALLAGEHVYGLVGALLAVPVASMVQTAFLYARRHSTAFNRVPEGP